MSASSGPVETAIVGRKSVRAFLADPVPQALVAHLLDIAARAPSGTNMQPWRAYVLQGDAKQRLSARLLHAFNAQPASSQLAEYDYYPDPFFEPYLSRRRTVGYDLYGLLGIARGDKERMKHQHGRNLLYFDAPIGLVFTVDRRLRIGSWLDYGMFLQTLMIAAREHGLETCVQAAFAPFHAVLREELPIGDHEIVVCGMSLGYADPAAPENGLATVREPARSFTTFLGFEDETGQGHE